MEEEEDIDRGTLNEGILGSLHDSEDERNLEIGEIDGPLYDAALEDISEQEEHFSDLEVSQIVKPKKRSKKQLEADGEPDALPGFEMSEEDKLVGEVDLKAELKRLGIRHRIDWVKWYFGKDGGYTIKQLKRIYRTEMQENP